MLTIEFESPREQGLCQCCGGRTIALTRFVHKNGNAHAVYLASYSDNHPEKIVSIAAGFGEWGDETTPSDRVAFAMQLQCKDSGYAVSIIDGKDSLWANAAFLGYPLSRAEALVHPLIQEAFHLTDHIVLEDKTIINYFGASGDA